jgi:hypothetical protein
MHAATDMAANPKNREFGGFITIAPRLLHETMRERCYIQARSIHRVALEFRGLQKKSLLQNESMCMTNVMRCHQPATSVHR